MAFKIDGWQRLGIVVSLLWIVALSFIAGLEYVKVQAPDDSLSLLVSNPTEYQVASQHFFFDRLKKKSFTFEQASGMEPLYDLLVFKYEGFAFLSLAPVLILWVVGYAIGWVKAGFHKRRGDSMFAGMAGHMDHWDRSDIQQAISRIDRILASDIFTPGNAASPLFRAAFIDVLISLRDLMYKTEKYASRISFTDDVTLTQQVPDVSALIKFVRNALCHPDSDNHFIEKGNIKATFNVCFGKGTLLKTPDFEQSSPYDDDVCFFFGSQRIFLRRHIVRAYDEARQKLLQIIDAG